MIGGEAQLRLAFTGVLARSRQAQELTRARQFLPHRRLHGPRRPGPPASKAPPEWWACRRARLRNSQSMTALRSLGPLNSYRKVWRLLSEGRVLLRAGTSRLSR